MPFSTTRSDPDRRRVPVEHRVLGLDRRSFPFALVVVAVFLVATVLVPRIDDAIAWDDPVRAGDRLVLDEGIVFTPALGWDVQSGYRLDDGATDRHGEAVVVGRGVTLAIIPGPFDGTPTALLQQVEKVTSGTDDPTFRVEGEPATLTTTAGDVGVVQATSSVEGDGLVAALVIDGTGLEVTVHGPPAQMTAATDDIDAMLASIHRTGTEGDAS